MKTIEIKVYTINELEGMAYDNALNKASELASDIEPSWVVDDCYLLEPENNELKEVGWDSANLLIKNTRKLYFDTSRRSIDISNAMDIQDDLFFYKWLGIDTNLQKKIISYEILDETIDFEIYSDSILTEKQTQSISNAVIKFEEHVSEIFSRIKKAYEYYQSEDYVLEYCEINEIVFTENGDIFNF